MKWIVDKSCSLTEPAEKKIKRVHAVVVYATTYIWAGMDAIGPIVSCDV